MISYANDILAQIHRHCKRNLVKIDNDMTAHEKSPAGSCRSDKAPSGDSVGFAQPFQISQRVALAGCACLWGAAPLPAKAPPWTLRFIIRP